MPWQQDPATGEWIMVDAEAARPPEGYAGPGMTFPVDIREPGEQAYDATDDEGLDHTNDPLVGPGLAAPHQGPYQNEDPSIIDRWERAAAEHGNEVRTTAVGTFEVDPGGRIVSECPLPYRVD